MQTPAAGPAMHARLDTAVAELAGLRMTLNGDPAPGRLNEPNSPGIAARVGRVMSHWNTRQMPTQTHRRNLEIAASDLVAFSTELTAWLATDLVGLEEALEAAGAPWTPGRRVP